jgi:hypothetical protein
MPVSLTHARGFRVCVLCLIIIRFVLGSLCVCLSSPIVCVCVALGLACVPYVSRRVFAWFSHCSRMLPPPPSPPTPGPHMYTSEHAASRESVLPATLWIPGVTPGYNWVPRVCVCVCVPCASCCLMCAVCVCATPWNAAMQCRRAAKCSDSTAKLRTIKAKFRASGHGAYRFTLLRTESRIQSKFIPARAQHIWKGFGGRTRTRNVPCFAICPPLPPPAHKSTPQNMPHP